MRRSPPVRMKRSGALRGLRSRGRRRALPRRSSEAPLAFRDLARKPARRLGNIPTPAIGDGDDEVELVARRGAVFRRRHTLHERRREPRAVADEADAHAIGVELGNLAIQGLEEKLHQ